MDLALKSKDRRIQIPQQPITDRCLPLDQAFECGDVQLRTRNFPHHAQVVEAIPGHAVGGQNLRATEEISLKINETLLPRGDELLPSLDLFRQHAAPPLPETLDQIRPLA